MTVCTTTRFFSGKFCITLKSTRKSPDYVGEPEGEWLDRLDGSFQPSSGGCDRGSFFHINLDDAIKLRDLLDEYIDFKQKSKKKE